MEMERLWVGFSFLYSDLIRRLFQAPPSSLVLVLLCSNKTQKPLVDGHRCCRGIFYLCHIQRSILEEQQFFYHNSSTEWILPNLLFIISSLPDPGDWIFAYIICVGISEEECGNSFLFFLFWLVAGVWCICRGKRRCPWHSSDPGMVGHRLWNQEACNWHRKQGLSGPDSWVCLEQPLYSPTHFSSHFLICFSIKAFSIQLKNISWRNSQLQRRRMVSHHHLNQHCRIPSSVLVLFLVLNGLKPEISSRPETWNLWKIWNIRFLRARKHEISDRSENMRFLDRSAALHMRGYFRENYCWFYVWGVLAILLSCESFKAALVVKDANIWQQMVIVNTERIQEILSI